MSAPTPRPVPPLPEALAGGSILPVVVDRATLLRASDPVGEVDAATIHLAADMLATMYAGGGVGLAAVQVGRHVRVIVMDSGDERRPAPVAMIDPVITWSKKATVVIEEGCLSIPGLRVDVERPSDVKVAFTGIDGVRAERSLGGWPARIVQHEIDHLDGVLITERRR